MHQLTLIKGGKSAGRQSYTPTKAYVYRSQAPHQGQQVPMVSVPLSILEELIREFNELKETWRTTKETIRQTF